MQRVVGALREVIEEAEILREEECAIVMQIVAHKPIRNRRLRGCSFQRRMRIDHSHGGVEAWIGNPEHPDLSIIIRDILYEPIDGVVSVGVLVDVLGALVWIEGSHVNINAF